MGKTSHKHSKKYDDEERSHRNNRGAKHSRNIPGQGMRVINDYYEDEDDDYFDDELDITDEVVIKHTKG